MQLSSFIARRYLFSRKSHSVINRVSAVSAATVAIPVMAMVVLLSVFNGFDALIRSMYHHFDPPVLIVPAEGKVFDINELDTAAIHALPEVEALSFTLQQTALFEYRGRQAIGTMRGVDSLYPRVVPIGEMVVQGSYELRFGDVEQALVGQGMAHTLSINPALVEPIHIYEPRRGRGPAILPIDLYRSREAFPAGIFALDGETDSEYVLVSIELARSLLEYGPGIASSVAVGIEEGADENRVRDAVAGASGERFRVMTRLQQKQELYRIMQYEKWGIYFIILLVLVIASFSIIGSLVLIILDKRRDTATLSALGADLPLIRRIFVREGVLISGLGMIAGLVLGIAVCLLQQRFGWIRMAGTSFLVDAYPVQIRWTDIAGVILSVSAVDWIIARLTVGTMIRRLTFF